MSIRVVIDTNVLVSALLSDKADAATMVVLSKALGRVSKMPEVHFRRLGLHFCVDFP